VLPEAFANRDDQGQLLCQFANQSRRIVFSVLNLSAWKFPQATHSFLMATLRHQDPTTIHH